MNLWTHESLLNIDQFLKISESRRTTRIDRPAKSRATLRRLGPPSNATAPPVVAIPVRWLGRLRDRPVVHILPLSNDILQTSQTRGCFDMRAFYHSLKKAGAQHSLSPVSAEYDAR
jgi:hypothetical protein